MLGRWTSWEEELEVIQPVIESFSAHNAELIGPLPADTLLPEMVIAERADAVLAMYHDQGCRY